MTLEEMKKLCNSASANWARDGGNPNLPWTSVMAGDLEVATVQCPEDAAFIVMAREMLPKLIKVAELVPQLRDAGGLTVEDEIATISDAYDNLFKESPDSP